MRYLSFDLQVCALGQAGCVLAEVPPNDDSVPGGLRLPLSGVALLPAALGCERKHGEGCVIAGGLVSAFFPKKPVRETRLAYMTILVSFSSAPLSRDADPEGREARCSQGKGCTFGKGTQARLGEGIRKSRSPQSAGRSYRAVAAPETKGAEDGDRVGVASKFPTAARWEMAVTGTVSIVILMCVLGPGTDEMDAEEESSARPKHWKSIRDQPEYRDPA